MLKAYEMFYYIQNEIHVFCCFVFQKSCTGNLLGIGRNKSRSSYYYRNEDGVQRRDEGAPQAATPGHVAAQALATPWGGVGPPRRPPTSPFRLVIDDLWKDVNTRASIHEKFHRSRHRRP
jgi:hypothetical protein